MESEVRELLAEMVSTIHENIRDLQERRSFADAEEKDYIEGKLQAYNEILSGLRSAARDRGLSHLAGLG